MSMLPFVHLDTELSLDRIPNKLDERSDHETVAVAEIT
jgi:hypothetical protein